jgi:hypothetical protein
MTALYLIEWPPDAIRIMLIDTVDGDLMDRTERYPRTWGLPANLIIIPL